MGLLVLIIPLGFAVSFWFFHSKQLLHGLNVSGAFLLLGSAFWLTIRVLTQEVLVYPVFNSFFYLDSLSVLILDTTLLVSFLVCIYAVGYLEHEYGQEAEPKKLKLFYSLTYAFIFTMVLVAVTQNLGIMWIAIEATTLASVFLVGFSNTKYSIEAAWKYIIICSVGIALALLGIVFLYFASSQSQGYFQPSLNWSVLYENAGHLHGSILKFAFIFVLLGFGTKAGLVPMHTWLPDAHSEAPSPISALLSGVLLNSAMYGIIRFLAILNKSVGSSLYAGRLMVFLGLLSIGSAAMFILAQKNYKRLLAYSSVEHMGIIALALGLFTPASLFAALFHMINHSLTKSMLFLAAGNVLQKFKTKDIAGISGLLYTMPFTGAVFLLGILAIAGSPPFSIFSSELNITLAAFTAGKTLPGVLFVLLISLAFGAIAYAILRMFFGKADAAAPAPGEINLYGNAGGIAVGNTFGKAVILFLLVAITITGFYLPPFLRTLLTNAGRIIIGG